jgi:hypothetical protein
VLGSLAAEGDAGLWVGGVVFCGEEGGYGGVDGPVGVLSADWVAANVEFEMWFVDVGAGDVGGGEVAWWYDGRDVDGDVR